MITQKQTIFISSNRKWLMAISSQASI